MISAWSVHGTEHDTFLNLVLVFFIINCWWLKTEIRKNDRSLMYTSRWFQICFQNFYRYATCVLDK